MDSQTAWFRGLTRLYVALTVFLWYLPWFAVGVGRTFREARSVRRGVGLLGAGNRIAVVVPGVGEVKLPGITAIEEVDPAIAACVGPGSRAGWRYQVADDVAGRRFEFQWIKDAPPSRSDAEEIARAARLVPEDFAIDDTPKIDEPLIAPVPGAKLTPREFAQVVKSRYPAYRDVDDVVLTRRVLARYPAYAEMVGLAPVAHLVCWEGALQREADFRARASYGSAGLRVLRAAGPPSVAAVVLAPAVVYGLIVGLALMVRWVIKGFGRA